MKKRFTFVARTPIMRGSNGSQLYKAGFFCFRIHGFFPVRYAACLYRAFKKRIPRASDGVRSDIWQVAFLSAYTRTPSNYAYQHTYHKRGSDNSNRVIAAQRKSAPRNRHCNWRRIARNNGRLERYVGGWRSGIYARCNYRKSRSIQYGHEGVARISSAIASCANAAQGAFQVTSKTFLHFTFLPGQPGEGVIYCQK